jgi:hypothetical protein
MLVQQQQQQQQHQQQQQQQQQQQGLNLSLLQHTRHVFFVSHRQLLQRRFQPSRTFTKMMFNTKMRLVNFLVV